jgi:recombination protein RecR
MDSLRRLEEIFAHFPGIGPRQARRFAYYLLGKPPAFIKEFTSLIEEVKKSTAECPQCHRLFIGGSRICSICSDANRDQSTLMVVARDSDFESIEKSAAYKGLYFILGGTVPILDKEPDKRIRLKQLLERVQKSAPKEIILSLNTTPDGEHTADIVKDALKAPLYLGKVTILGRGLSTGAELEYADSDTIKNALKNRN